MSFFTFDEAPKAVALESFEALSMLSQGRRSVILPGLLCDLLVQVLDECADYVLKPTKI